MVEARIIFPSKSEKTLSVLELHGPCIWKWNMIYMYRAKKKLYVQMRGTRMTTFYKTFRRICSFQDYLPNNECCVITDENGVKQILCSRSAPLW